MSDRMCSAPASLESLEDRVLFSVSEFMSVAAPPSSQTSVLATPAAGPEISARRGDEVITDGQSSFLYFPAELQGTTASTAHIVISNDGTATLNLGQIVVPTGYVVISRPPATLEPGETGALRVRLNTAAAPGTYTGQISIATNDADENPFNFPVSGRIISTSAPRDMDVFPWDPTQGPEIAPNSTVNIGQANVGGTLEFTFRVRSDGGSPLTVSNIQVPAGFTLVDNLDVTTLPTGEWDFFTIRANTTLERVLSGDIVITSNDPDPEESSFRFTVLATIGDPDSGGGGGTIDPDAFEGATGDNTPQNSRFHFNNDRYRFHTIHNNGDTDWVRFYVPQTSYVAVRAVHPYDDPGATSDLRMQLYGPKVGPNNPDELILTAPNWNASAVPQPDRPNDTILVRAGFRALTQGWYWLQVDGMGGTVSSYGIRVYVRPLAAADAAQVEAARGLAAQPSSAALAAYAAQSQQTSQDDSESDGTDTLLEIEPVLSFLA